MLSEVPEDIVLSILPEVYTGLITVIHPKLTRLVEAARFEEFE